MHYRTWSPSRPTHVVTVIENDDHTSDDYASFYVRGDGFVEVRRRGGTDYVPHHQILAFYSGSRLG